MIFFDYANVILRAKAFLMDYMLIFCYLLLLVFTSLFLLPDIQMLFSESLVRAQFASFVLITLPVSLYFIVFDSSVGKQTFGKRMVKLQVVNRDGDALSFLHSAFRVFLKFLPWELSHFIVYRFVNSHDVPLSLFTVIVAVVTYGLIITFIVTAIFSKKKQSLYDMIAKTYVKVKRS